MDHEVSATATPLTTEQLIAQLTEGTARLTTSSEWLRWLDVQRRFHDYSFGNCLLIARQRPEATRIAGFHTWKKFRRSVRKGEHGIRILAPMTRGAKRDAEGDAAGEGQPEKTVRFVVGFKAVSVFDISQTDGEDLPAAPVQRLSGDAPESAFAELTRLAGERGYTVELIDVLVGERNGDCNFAKRLIRVRATMAPAMRLKTLAHELTHAMLHEQFADRALAELEAESVAYVVLGAGMGIDASAYSFGYVATWMGAESPEKMREAIRASGDRISDTARAILGGLDLGLDRDRERREAA